MPNYHRSKKEQSINHGYLFNALWPFSTIDSKLGIFTQGMNTLNFGKSRIPLNDTKQGWPIP